MKKKNKKEQEEDTSDSLQKADDGKRWQEDPQVPFPDDEKSEVIKLQVNEQIEGELVDIVPSTSWKGRNIYKIDDGDGIIKVILGTTMLDRQMSLKSIGDWVKIKRIMDKPTDKGNPLQQYITYSRKA